MYYYSDWKYTNRNTNKNTVYPLFLRDFTGSSFRVPINTTAYP